MTVKSYLSYGLKFKSEISLPDLLTTEDENDILIRRGDVRNTAFYKNFNQSEIINRPGIKVRASKNTFCFDWEYLGACLIEGGSNVTVELNQDVDERDFVPYITGPVSAVLLHQRNYLVLHASAVNINNSAIAFLGNKGYGKSTLAAHLQSRGHQLISDDLVPVKFCEGFAETEPGHPQIRLFPDSIESIGLNCEELPLVNKWLTKRYLRPKENFSPKPIKIGAVFVLDMGDTIKIEKISLMDAFIEVTRNSFLSHYIKATDSTDLHFEQCQKLINSISVLRLQRPAGFNFMSQVSEVVEQIASNKFGQ